MAELLKGAPAAEAIDRRSAADVQKLGERGVAPTLAIVRVGSREDDLAYEKGAVKRCEKVGVRVERATLPEDVSQPELMELIDRLNADGSVHGVLLLLPLPKQLDQEAVRRALLPSKDVDGITDGSLAGVFTASGEGYAPCTAQACIELLDFYGYELKGKRATVIGRSLVVGKPVSMLLLARHATVTICHTRTADLPAAAKNAEILICAAGKAGTVGAELVSPGQTVIDVGINFVNGKMCGDADMEAVESIVSAITPVPGGVGAVTTSVLVNHVVEAAKRQTGII